MKYFKHTWMIGGEKIIRAYQPEGTNMHIPPKEGNSDYARLLEEVEAGLATIQEVDDTPE